MICQVCVCMCLSSVCVCACACVCICVRVHASMCVHMCVYECACMRVSHGHGSMTIEAIEMCFNRAICCCCETLPDKQKVNNLGPQCSSLNINKHFIMWSLHLLKTRTRLSENTGLSLSTTHNIEQLWLLKLKQRGFYSWLKKSYFFLMFWWKNI